jgi:hypothetical protein
MNKAHSNVPELDVVSHHGVAEVILNRQTGQYSLHAEQSFEPGEVISPFQAGEICSTPNYLTVQTGINRHITLIPEFLQYINHSCQPNAFFDTDRMELVALKPIGIKEEISFFYPSTEYDMAQPFLCFCGSQDCLRNIRGAKYLSEEIQNKYRFTGFIRQLL